MFAAKVRMKRRRRSQPSRAPVETSREGRVHGDSYADVSSREPDLAATTSTHDRSPDRGREEPSDAAVDAPERLEGSV